MNQFLDRLQPSSWIKSELRSLQSLIFKVLREQGWAIFVLLVLGIMVFWNWKLLLATGVGIAMMIAVYKLQGREWQRYWSHCQRSLQGVNQQLMIAVSTGGIGALTTYMATSIWVEAENRWFAFNSIVQSLLTLGVLTLLSWQTWNRRKHQDDATWDRLLTELTHPDPLKRLIAVRQLTRLMTARQVKQSDRRQVQEYLTVMLSQKQPRILREAILESLQLLQPFRALEQSPQPLKMPLNLKRTSTKVRHRVENSISH